MVERENALTFLNHETSLSSQADHSQLSKLSHTDGTYIPIVNAIGNALHVPVKIPTALSDYFPA